MTKTNKGEMTATEIMVIENAKYHSLMNWKMARALVEGRVDSSVLRWAEEIYETQKDIFTNQTKANKSSRK